MIEQLAEHGVQAIDLVPSLMTTHTVANPEYDPEEARRCHESPQSDHLDFDDADDISIQTLVEPEPQQHQNAPTYKNRSQAPDSKTQPPSTPPASHTFPLSSTTSNPTQITAKVLADTTTTSLAGVTTTLSSVDKDVTLDIRWTVICDLFLISVADSVYDARSRVLLERVAEKLGLGWSDVIRFESRVTEALEIQEDIEKLEQQDIVEGVQKARKGRRYMMMGLATLGTTLFDSRSIVHLQWFRWRSRHRSLCGSLGTCHWHWSRRCIHNYRNHWYWRILRRNCRRCSYNHRGYTHRRDYRWTWNGEEDEKCSYI